MAAKACLPKTFVLERLLKGFRDLGKRFEEVFLKPCLNAIVSLGTPKALERASK